MVCSFFLRSRLLGYFLSPSRFPKRARLPTSRLKDVFNHADSSLSLSLSLFLYASVCVYFIVYFVGRQITCSYDLSGRKPSAGPPPSAPSVRFTTTGTILPKSSIASFRWFQRFLSSCFFLFCCCCCCFFFLGRGLGAARSGASSIRWRFLFSPPVLYAHVRCYDSKLTFPFEKRLHSYSKYCRTQTRQYQVDIKGISEK